MQSDTISRVLLVTDGLLLGEFWCPPHSERWHSLNSVSAEPHVIFPRTPVTIRQLGREPAICDRNQIVFYNPGQRFFRSLRSRTGDHCYYVELSPELMRRLAGGSTSFPFSAGPSDASVFLLQRLAVRQLKEPEPDLELVERALTLALETAIERGRRFHELRAEQRESTRTAQREIVDHTRVILDARFRERLRMAEVANSLDVSRFQLSRFFRSHTGFSLLEYRNQLRVRAALDRLPDSETRLSTLAAELGFSNPSHLTAAFRESFGVLPSELRGRIDGRTLSAAIDRHAATTNVRLSAPVGAASSL
ncbi:MAG TPA: AraC family transcriptional regulator [Gaiellaceae bacterium]|nr:AraC family transcriptional regulator [Gaiellaceae bacterium]